MVNPTQTLSEHGRLHSIKKQGPPPWGMNHVGILLGDIAAGCVMVLLSLVVNGNGIPASAVKICKSNLPSKFLQMIGADLGRIC